MAAWVFARCARAVVSDGARAQPALLKSAPQAAPRALLRVDRRVERWVVHHRTGWLDPIFQGLSYAGTDGIIWLVAAIALALLWRRAQVFVVVVVVDAVADLAASGLKAAIPRDRPTLRYPEPRALVHTPGSHSFPSGHAATRFACAVAITWFVPRLAAPLFVLAVAVAFSRVY